MVMNNLHIAKIFNQLADVLEILEDNPFKIRAYRKAAQSIESLSESVSYLKDNNKLSSVPGLGKAIVKKIEDILETGKLKLLEEKLSQIPSGLLELLEIHGLGPKKVGLLWKGLEITTLDELEKAARDKKIQTLSGMGEKTEENILKAVDFFKKSRGRTPLGLALPIAEKILKDLENMKEIYKVSCVGSLRRGADTVRDINILIATKEKKLVLSLIKNYMAEKAYILIEDANRVRFKDKGGIEIDINCVDANHYGAALQYFTGSREHNESIRELAYKKGFKLDKDGAISLDGEDEIEIYNTIGINWIPPELREGRDEIQLASKGKLPNLVDKSDIKSDLQMHTLYSDGEHSIKDMAMFCQSLGYEYMAVTDHSQSLKVAGGLSEERLMEMIQEVRKLNQENKGFTILAGSEVDILNDGTLDYSDEVLSKLDWVVASLHSGFHQNRDQIMKRIYKAMENPYVRVIGHPTGRLINQRPPIDIDIKGLAKKAAQTHIALEINAHYLRLDLGEENLRIARDQGCLFCINTDSHSQNELLQMRYGVMAARRGGLETGHIINTYSLQKLLSWIKEK